MHMILKWSCPLVLLLFALPIDGAVARADALAEDAQIWVAQAPSAKARSRKRPRDRAMEIESPSKTLEQIEEELERIREYFAKTKQDYGNPESPFPVEGIRRQYEEATYLYLVEDFEKAALLFYAVLKKASRPSFLEYEEAEFFLAESLELGANLYPALEYYTRIVEYGPAHRYYDPAVVKMIELYAKTGNFAKFTAYYSSYMERSQGVEPTDEILYALGKTLYAQEEYEQALASFQRLSDAGGNFPHLAQYFIGAIHVARGDFNRAIQAFTELSRLRISTKEQREVADLGYLALGRLYSEQGNYAKALVNYQKVPSTSKHFVDALYEQSWTHILQENYDEAIRSIDILLLTFPDDVNVPRLKLKRGLLQQKRGEYDEALDTYQKLVAEYTGIKEELDRIMQEREDILTYFNELIDSDLSRIDSSYLVPTLAIRFATADKEMSQVLGIARDLRLEQLELQESFQMMQEMEAQVYGESHYNLLVGMRKARSSLNEMQNRILLAKERSIQAEQAYLLQLPDEAAQAQARAWIAQHGDDGSLAKQIPELQRDLTEIVEVYEDQVQEVQRNAYKLENYIEDLLAQSAAIEKYITYSRESGTLTPDGEQQARFRVASERDQLDSYLKSLSSLQRDLADFDVRRMVRQRHSRTEDEFRGDAEQRLVKTRRGMMGLRARLRADGRFTERADILFDQLSILSSDISKFERELTGIETQLVSEVRKDLQREKEVLGNCGLAAQKYGEQTETLAQDVALRSFANIQQQFSDLILEADFGITDVYWELKEEKSNEIDVNNEQRSDEIQLLRKKFSGLQDEN